MLPWKQRSAGSNPTDHTYTYSTKAKDKRQAKRQAIFEGTYICIYLFLILIDLFFTLHVHVASSQHWIRHALWTSVKLLVTVLTLWWMLDYNPLYTEHHIESRMAIIKPIKRLHPARSPVNYRNSALCITYAKQLNTIRYAQSFANWYQQYGQRSLLLLHYSSKP